MRLSIIIPVYNVEAYIGECLQSVVQQDISSNEYEVIVINDGSTDNSATILHEFAKQHPNIVVLNQANAGVSTARNAGIEIAQGDYMMFVDSDDYIEPNSLSNLLSFAEQNNVDLLQYGCNIIRPNTNQTTDNQTLSSTVFNTKEEYVNTHFFAKEIWNAEMWRFLFKNSFTKEKDILFCKEITMGEDQLFTLQHIFYANKIASIPSKIYNYRIREGSAVNTSFYNHAVSQLMVAAKIKDLIQDASEQVTETEILFYKRFINIFVIHQYIDRVFNSSDVKNPVKTIKRDVTAHQMNTLYSVHHYKEEMQMVKLYNFSIYLYCMQSLFKRKIKKFFN